MFVQKKSIHKKRRRNREICWKKVFFFVLFFGYVSFIINRRAIGDTLYMSDITRIYDVMFVNSHDVILRRKYSRVIQEKIFFMARHRKESDNTHYLQYLSNR